MICKEFKEGNTEKSREISFSLIPIMREMFCEVNPIPIKEALFQMGLCKNQMRLPLTNSSRKEEINSLLKRYNLL